MDYKTISENIATTVDEETYFMKTLSNNIVRISAISSETYGKLIHDIGDEKIIYPKYEIKDDRAYRIVIRDLDYCTSTNEIKNELNVKGLQVMHIINVKHRTTKGTLSLLFVYM
jgi:predicted transcriptional regulator YdeE